ncbi:metallophosphoesterase [Marinovum sp. 2_MG-2023]|uniref:metallophosphoesterase family protein n=1 Tax=unclassified Marinovum TaxID=2647166 RepID=UPI0026E2321F|nr:MULTISPECIES: metallophosphoesterase [unclassified Marinovum]MDO6729190.1 metallophosphoesterase [Marinovum sp. 2_MG-2023]MDO6779183.1 metallophosphoesterase [Marinovum sp. 1_MG-2023]
MLTKFQSCLALIAVAFAIFAASDGTAWFLTASLATRALGSDSPRLFDRSRIHDLRVGEEFSLLAAGDIASCDVDGIDRLRRNIGLAMGLKNTPLPPNKSMVVTTSILDQHPDLGVLALGDLAYNRGEPLAFQDCYDPFWGRAKARTWPTPGNHEYRSPGAFGYFDYWTERAGPDRNGYYALRAGSWIILSLNSETDASDGSDQAVWLADILAAHPEACIGAMFHRPAYSAVARGGSEAAKQLFARLADAGAVFVLNGHNHFLERTKPLDAGGTPATDGTTIFVAGAGGKVSGKPVVANERTAELITDTPGVLKLDFSSDAVGWSYLGENRIIPGSGALPCRRTPARATKTLSALKPPVTPAATFSQN